MADEKNQNQKVEQTPAPLQTMIGKGNFIAREGEEFEKIYKIIALEINDIEEFKLDKLFIPSAESPNDGFGQFIFLQDKKYCEAFDKWLKKYLFFDNEPVTFDMIKQHKWTLDDVGRFLRMLTRVSG